MPSTTAVSKSDELPALLELPASGICVFQALLLTRASRNAERVKWCSEQLCDHERDHKASGIMPPGGRRYSW